MMDLGFFATRFASNAEAIQSLVQGVTDEQARWKPTPEDWSILEVINHLYDEEREDFRKRLDLLLHQPGKPWPGIDPVGWVVERSYNTRDPEASLHSFLGERQRSVSWLGGLSSADWEASHHHPVAGELKAGDLLASWLAHDFLHLRQLVQLHWQYISVVAESHSRDYAGPW